MLLLLSLGLALTANAAANDYYDTFADGGKASRRKDIRRDGKHHNYAAEKAVDQQKIAELDAQIPQTLAKLEKQRQHQLFQQREMKRNASKQQENLEHQQSFDRQQETNAAADVQARIADVAEQWRVYHENQQIERARALNAGVFGARARGVQRNEDEFRARVTANVAEARAKQAEVERKAAMIAADEAEGDMLQLKSRFRRAAHKAAVHAKNTDALGIAKRLAEIEAEKADIKRLRQKTNRRLFKAFGPAHLRSDRRVTAEDQAIEEMDARSLELEQEKSYLQQWYEWFVHGKPRHELHSRPEQPAYPTAFVKESALVQAY